MVDELHAFDEIRDEEALEAIVPRLPVEACEVLFLYMAGETYEQIILDRETPSEPVHTTDFESALGRGGDDPRRRHDDPASRGCLRYNASPWKRRAGPSPLAPRSSTGGDGRW